MTFSIVRASAVLCVGMMVCSGAALGKQVWDMPNEYNDSSLHAQSQRVFAETLEAATDGEIQISHHFGGAMGFRSQDQFDAVGDGALPIANTNITTLGGIDPYYLLSSLPFLVRSAEEAQILWAISKPVYAEIFDRNNQVLLYASPWTPAGLWSTVPVNSVTDFEALKVRTWDATGTRTLIHAKTNAVQLNWGDVMPQLATGGINAVLTSSEGGVNAKFWEQLKYFTPLNYSMSLNVTHMNKDVFESLSEEQQQAILQASQAAEEIGWQGVVERQEDNFVEMNSYDVKIADQVPEALLDRLSEASKPIIEEWLKQTGQVGNDTLRAYYEAVARE